MTTATLNASIEIRNIANVVFRKNSFTTYTYHRGFAFYMPGHGYLGFKTAGQPYVLDRKYVLQSILDAGGWVSLDNMTFFQPEN